VVLNDAFKEILPRYSYAPLGTPFVDVIAHAGGTMSLASFDGGAPGVESGDVGNFLADSALALTQIALRPTIDRFGPQWQEEEIDVSGQGALALRSIPKAVAYIAIRKKPGNGADKVATVDIDLQNLLVLQA